MTKIDPSLIDVVFPEHDGYPENLAAEDTNDALWDCCGEAAREFPQHLWIEPKDWADAARDNDKYHTWPIDYIDRFTNQSPTHECTTHALRACFECCRNRQRAIAVGPPVVDAFPLLSATAGSVWVSCLSIYSEANPRIRGGANVRQVMEIASRRGFLPDKIQPRDYGFNHVLTGTNGNGNATQSGGAWVALKDFPDGWTNTSRHFRPLEVIFPTSIEQTICLVLRGRAVGVGRSGHSIPYARYDPTEKLMAYVDSYNVVRYDSWSKIRSTVGGSYSIATVTAPDDWQYPAGR